MTKEEYWQNDIYELCEKFSSNFDIWWDSYKFDWNYSNLLCYTLPDKFDIWWDPEKFDWERNSKYLIRFLFNKIVKYYNTSKIKLDTHNILNYVNNLEWNYD